MSFSSRVPKLQLFWPERTFFSSLCPLGALLLSTMLSASNHWRLFIWPFIVLYPCNFVAAATDFVQCLLEVQNGTYGPNAGVDNYGRPVNFSIATAIPYDVCVSACGGGPEAFNWSDFSNQFSSWLLPWLALLSQLPFGANDSLENFLSVVLAVGSPALAAYSAALTVLNGRWIARRFSASTYPNTYYAVRTLSSLQQAPIRLNAEREEFLASLVILPQNDNWWKTLLEHIEYTHTWSVSAATSIAWVLIAYVFTVIQSLSFTVQEVEVNGQAVGSVWLWLLPVVISWLQISPKCDSVRVKDALGRANDIAYVARPDDAPKRASLVSGHRAIFLDEDDDPLHNDERCTSPIYNYSRLFLWTVAVEEISSCFHEATRRSRLFQSVSKDIDWVPGNRHRPVPALSRLGTSSEVTAYCTSPFPRRRSRWGSGVWGRIIVASIMALLLQWGTSGAAVFVQWQTPTRGLGCRSASYLLYAIVSTVVWALLLIANILSHYSTINFYQSYDSREQEKYHTRADPVTVTISVALRRLAKTIATANALFILSTCIFQFSAFFDRCYCDSSVLGRGAAKAFNVIQFNPEDLSLLQGAWIEGVFIAVGSAAIYVAFINMFINPTLPNNPNRE